MRKTLITAATALSIVANTMPVSAQTSAPTSAKAPLLDIKPHNLTLSVPDLERTAAWYDDILGFKIEKTQNFPEFKTRIAMLERGGFRIELIEDANAKPGIVRADVPAHTAIHGITQFMFQTPDISIVKERLASKRIPIHFEFENKELGVRIFFVRDPNQNLIGFLQRLR